MNCPFSLSTSYTYSPVAVAVEDEGGSDDEDGIVEPVTAVVADVWGVICTADPIGAMIEADGSGRVDGAVVGIGCCGAMPEAGGIVDGYPPVVVIIADPPPPPPYIPVTAGPVW
jgi:hypothetical protein